MIFWLIHLALCGVMTGIIWLVQIIHYPLYRQIPEAAFQEYESRHTFLAGILIAPIMLGELISGIIILLSGFFSSGLLMWLNMVFLALIWLSTFIIQAPTHQKLIEHYNPQLITKLVRTNWIRTILWTSRLILLALGTHQLFYFK